MRPSLSTLVSAIAERSAYSVISQSRLSSEPLRQHLRQELVQFPGTGHSFVGDPVLEAAFGWQPAEPTMADLSGGLLHPRLVDILDGDGVEHAKPERERYRFGRSWHPHAHQLEAWRLLSEEPPRSVLVASGTGSGKTECFLIPILNDLAKQADRGASASGVQALFLYPLNALINSQRDRLTDWTHGFGGKVRFCLYNGETPQEKSESEQRASPSEILSRKLLRQDPPQILVTNITMLEYMLVRTEDKPILAKSRGKLRWIVLDEAHSYIGSQAAELALLLRRVMRAFDVSGSEVRFVATSATIGEGKEVENQLRAFLADLAGVSEDRVTVVTGNRQIPGLPSLPNAELPDSGELAGMTPEAAYGRLAANSEIRDLRRKLVDMPMRLSDAVRVLFPKAAPDPTSRRRALDLVEQAGRARLGDDALLPLRLHLFHRAQPGFWACVDPACPGRSGTPLDSPDWHYGAVHFNETDRCSHCNSPTFEILGCTHCGAPVLAANELEDGLLVACQSSEDSDEFAQDIDSPDGDGDDDYVTQDSAAPLARILIVDPAHSKDEPLWLDRVKVRLLDKEAPGALRVGRVHDEECPHCESRHDASPGNLFRATRLGAPFLLGNIVPQLLEATPPGRTDEALPFDGRQLITFTDSRQGTARFAAKLQQDAERNFIRSAIYHTVQAAGQGGHAEEIAELEDEISDLEAVIGTSQKLRERYESKRRKVEALKADTPSVSWSDMRLRLASLPDLQNWMWDMWRGYDRDFSDASRVADFQLFREFLRRPNRQNSAETMGLASLRFDEIDRLSDRQVPAPFIERGLTVFDWRDFLYVMTTHFLRNRSAVALDHGLKHWVGRKVSIKHVKKPEELPLIKSREIAWPWATRASHTGRVIRLLSAGLNLDLADPAQRDRINECLYAAYQALAPLRDGPSADFVLDLRKARFGMVDKGWLCPRTSLVLDRAFLGITPYMPLGSKIEVARCEPILMPQLPFPWRRLRDGTDVSADAVTEWLSNDERVRTARDKGSWTNLHDRIAAVAPYIRSVEHSAQQPSTRLIRYEKLFKQGKINVLNCSTTMEMGVDIGGLSTVVMTNVPPAPANYRQRVGRAGRRGEALSIGFTFCKDNPLGWAVFKEPVWPFSHVIRPPRVSLDSPVIVQRHVNAMLLSAFLHEHPVDPGILKLQSGMFFEPSTTAKGEDKALCLMFENWCEAPAGLPDRVEADVQVLVAGTCLDGRTDLRFDTSATIAEVANAWRSEWQSLKDELDARPKDSDGARKSIENQIKRLSGTYLLAELASRGVLPGYGFPTDIVSFFNATAGRSPDSEDEEKPRDDNRFKARGYPTRQLSLAIRDYAPGADVVVDGLVYRSAGVTLNWKRPASDENAREIQAIGFVWKCGSCGVTDTSRTLPELCSACGKGELTIHEYLQPAGFSVDVWEKAHADITEATYLQPVKPWVSARNGLWTVLPDPMLGRHRVTRSGHVFYFAPGAGGQGYAVCLHCGRSAAEHGLPGTPGANYLPEGMEGHVPLRSSAKGRKHEGPCSGGDFTWGIKRRLKLGHGVGTDVFELQIYDLSDKVVAASLAVALREALARRLGIETGELGWAAVRSRGEGMTTCYSLFLYDLASGGAGFASTAGELVSDLLRDAEMVLRCPADCRSACHACLLARDTQYDEDRLDRLRALEYLGTSIINRLELPAELAFFGPASRAEVVPLVAALDRAMLSRAEAALQVWIGGAPADWDFAAWPAVPLFEKWGAKGRSVTLTLHEDTAATLTNDQKIMLHGLVQRSRADLTTTPSLPKIGAAAVLARVRNAIGDETWVGRDPMLGIADAGWAKGHDSPIVVGSLPQGDSGWTRKIDVGALFQAATERADLIRIATEANGPVKGFGNRFWNLILGRKPEIGQLLQHGGRLAEVIYQDRYLLSPLPVRLLCEVLRPVVNSGSGKPIDVLIRTKERRAPEYGQIPMFLTDDWANSAHRDAVTLSALSRLGIRARIKAGHTRDLPHERTLWLRWEHGGELRIHLDQGLGHWNTTRPSVFPFTSRPEEQATALLDTSFSILNRSAHPMSVFVLDIMLPNSERADKFHQ